MLCCVPASQQTVQKGVTNLKNNERVAWSNRTHTATNRNKDQPRDLCKKKEQKAIQTMAKSYASYHIFSVSELEWGRVRAFRMLVQRAVKQVEIN